MSKKKAAIKKKRPTRRKAVVKKKSRATKKRKTKKKAVVKKKSQAAKKRKTKKKAVAKKKSLTKKKHKSKKKFVAKKKSQTAKKRKTKKRAFAGKKEKRPQVTITDIYKPIDDSCAESLERIQHVLSSDSYFAGLGNLSTEYPVPKGFNLITDYNRCVYLLTSQLMWDEKDSKTRDQNFADVLGDAVDYLGVPAFERYEAKRRQQSYFYPIDKGEKRRSYIAEINKSALEKNGVAEYLAKGILQAAPTETDSFIVLLESYTQDIFDRLIRAAYFGGLEKWPVCEHLLECFSIGGFPVGWVGSLPRKKGNSRKCMQLLHFGPTK